MADNKLVESGLVVVAEAEPQAALVESGLIVVTESFPHHALVESGLVVAFQSEPIHRFVEAGIIIITEAEEAADAVLIQGEEILRDYTLQGQALEDGPFFSEPD